MRLPPALAVLLIPPLLAAAYSNSPPKRSYSTHDYYVLEHDPGFHSLATLPDVLLALGVEIVEQVGAIDNHWLVRVPKDWHSEESSRVRSNFSTRGVEHDRVIRRYHELLAKRAEPISSRSTDYIVASSIRGLEKQVPRQRVKRQLPAPPPPTPPSITDLLNAKISQVAARLDIHDPDFPGQWHHLNPQYPGMDLNVTGLWEMGITGRGIYSAVVDDGLDYESEDLAENFYPEGSWDFNDNSPLPAPRLSDDQHGTRCAGEIAAGRNTACGVGVAYDSKIAGIRILSGPISDADEASALNYGFQNTSIYSCSWGPTDDGMSMEAPNDLIKKAMVTGINKGRGGKGSIFVFASGNGASSGDQCNFDGYTNSIYSVTVAAVDVQGKHPYYSEPCAANMIVTYSSGGGNNIHTTDRGKNKCTASHGGTSAAAPLAVGVFALALQVRPDLTWRDIQHLCVQNANQINPEDPDWEHTAVGRPYSYKYGFGVLDAWTYINAVRNWQLVKPQAWLELEPITLADGDVSPDGNMTGGVPIPVGGVSSVVNIDRTHLAARNFEKLEHITVKVWITHTRRGDVEVELVSPRGIRSMLAGKRPYDQDTTGYPGWQFMTLKHWDEDPTGQWSIRVWDQAEAGKSGNFLGWSMTLWGSVIDPSKAEQWTFPTSSTAPPEPEATAPPSESATAAPGASVAPTPAVDVEESASSGATPTKQYSKPTDHLPPDHGEAEGESHLPTFGNGTNATPSPSISSTPDEGYFSHMSDLLGSQTWLFVALGGVVLFGVGAGVLLWRRRVRRRGRGRYSTVADGDDMPMGAMDPAGARLLSRSGGAARTKELYDAFGELDDDDSDMEDEEMGRGSGIAHSPVGLTYHDGFLEDDEDRHTSGSNTPAPLYHDEPTAADLQRERVAGLGAPADSDLSPLETSTHSDSGSGSWEHASETLRP
ncbi:hypothetical protein BOTBODRAFT_171611 [Botryobasidium botryosum FD-172 SS1]|uniref:P/Homo B domain-containing protein n=1 Tax=Botryobasidium botryosum (strain FD-172 SS1) TaxID=930990 RepID=A0A067MQA5_BOTB1|nr:hypothetical protein BOTBODRAFT_171611 [Botryobasidium botryosum FD-172 SS1]